MRLGSKKGEVLYLRLGELYGVRSHFECGFKDLKGAISLEPHFHDGFELTYISDGEVSWVLEDGSELRLFGGWSALTMPGVVHKGKWNVISPSRIFWVIFDPRRFHARGSSFTALSREGAKLAAEAFQRAGDCSWLASDELKADFEESRLALRKICGAAKPEPLALDRMKLAISKLLLSAVDSLEGRAAPSRSVGLMEEALAIIRAEFMRPLKVSSLAARLGVSKVALTEAFKRGAGLTPADCVRRARCEKAMEMLKDGRLSISEIAFKLSFPSGQYFAEVFKRYIGMTPTQFRGSCSAAPLRKA